MQRELLQPIGQLLSDPITRTGGRISNDNLAGVRHGLNTINHLDSRRHRRFSTLAAQPWLGLWPERNRRADRCRTSDNAFDRSPVTRVIYDCFPLDSRIHARRQKSIDQHYAVSA